MPEPRASAQLLQKAGAQGENGAVPEGKKDDGGRGG